MAQGSSINAIGESAEPWIPSASATDLSAYGNPQDLILGQPPTIQCAALPSNELIPHTLSTLAAAQNLATTPVGDLDHESSETLEFEVADAYFKMRDIFNYITSEAVARISALNWGLVAATSGNGSGAYEKARQAYLDFLNSKGGYDKAISALVVQPAIAQTTETGQTGIIIGARIMVKWSNPHSSSSGIPIYP